MNWTKYWDDCRKKLKEEYDAKWKTKCEVQFRGCMQTDCLGFHHRHKRRWYKIRGREKLLGSFDHTILVCNACHDLLEVDKKLTEKIFSQLRPLDK